VGITLPLTSCGRNQGETASGFEPTGVSGLESFTFVEVGTVRKLDGQGTEDAVAITVLDRTGVDGYWVYRDVGSTGTFNKPVAYAGPFQTTFNRGFQFFNALDRDWQPNRSLTYMSRGVVNGVESGAAPITNKAFIPSASSVSDLTAVDFEQIDPADTLEVDSLLILQKFPLPNTNPQQFEVRLLGGFSWDPVPGATRYLLNCIRSDGVLFLILMTPDNGTTTIDLTNIVGPVIHQNLPLSPSTFFWTVDALDANWRIVGHTTSRQIFIVQPRFTLCGEVGIGQCIIF
jgi:hypothetical protein